MVEDKDGGNGSAGLATEVVNAVPAVDAGPDQTVLVNAPLLVSGSFSDLGTLDTHTIRWDFGEGTIVTGSLTVTHAFVNAGSYTVTLTVVDDDGGQGMDSLVVSVSEYTIYLPITIRQSQASSTPVFKNIQNNGRFAKLVVSVVEPSPYNGAAILVMGTYIVWRRRGKNRLTPLSRLV
jgi:PKD repeat protein